MKVIKLVIGKTYLSRDNKKVTIVKRDNWNVNYPFQDKNGNEYTEKGISIKQYGIIKCGYDLLKEIEV